MRIDNMAVNQTVVMTGEETIFFSYETPVAKIDHGFLVLSSKAFDYSRTTSKYLMRFIREYTSFNPANKKAVEKLIKDGNVFVQDEL